LAQKELAQKELAQKELAQKELAQKELAQDELAQSEFIDNEALHRSPSSEDAVLLDGTNLALSASVFDSYPDQETLDDIYINNAGLVLLWPFLSSLFAQLEVIQEGMMQQPEQAVLLIHGLLSDDFAESEHELVLNKILCGLALHTPLVLDPSRYPDQKSLLDSLLQAAIQHWSALGSVSPTWFRQVFLQRNGVLKRQQSTWLLQVEGAPADVLLNKLPWGISTIKLPWMPQPLMVQWAY